MPDPNTSAPTPTTLDDVYEVYCTVAWELSRVPKGSERAEKLQQEADAQWLQYVNQGGGREPQHVVQEEWQYHDEFHDLSLGASLGPLQKLRVYLHLPKHEGDNVFWYPEQDAVKAFQANHRMPVTGVVNRATWQAILRENPEWKQAKVMPRWFEVPGNMTAPAPIVIRTRRTWMMALDDVPERTYANQSNLAALALLSYSHPNVIRNQLVDEWNKPRIREDVAFTTDDEFYCKLFAREAPSDFAHQVEYIEDTDTDTELFVLSSPAYLVISFRGTMPTKRSIMSRIEDITTDLAAQGVTWMYDGTFQGPNAAGKLGLTVHRGFLQGFDSIRDRLRAVLDDFLAPGKPIFITGHSLGAALACLCACYLRSHPRFSSHPVRCYTFAQPRVGTLPFARHYWRSDAKFTYFRIAHMFDTVTMVPSNYLAEDIASYRGLLDQYFENKVALEVLLAALYPSSATKQLLLSAACPPWQDYRHFGELVLCGVNAQSRPFVEQIGDADLPRTVEPPGSAGTQSVWRSNPLVHSMLSYVRFMMHEFEQHAMAFIEGRAGGLSLSGAPALDAREINLFYRFVHSYNIPPYYSMAEYRRSYETSQAGPASP